jgi:hypothetical protein
MRSTGSVTVVSMSTPVPGWASRSQRASEKPFSPGMFTSSTTMSGGPSGPPIAARPAAASAAASTVRPCERKYSASALLRSGSSSTTSTRGAPVGVEPGPFPLAMRES